MANCIMCGTEEYATYDPSTDDAWCDGPGHPEPRNWQPKADRDYERELRRQGRKARRALGGGIARELGLYEILPEILRERVWMETGVVEYLYAVGNEVGYEFMLDRWGHSCQGQRKYSTTSFIGGTLGDLSRETAVHHRSGPGSGVFSHNSTVGYWTLGSELDHMETWSWASFAVANGLRPERWPLAGCDGD